MTTSQAPNYALRRAVAFVIFCLFIYFVALPTFIFLVRAFCYAIIGIHALLVSWGVPLPVY